MLLHHEISGSGEPLVMLHGLFGSFENLGAIARQLAEHFTLYRLDLRNHGKSGHSDKMTFDLMARDVLETLDELGISKAHFFGHSLGGKVAMVIALNNPERVEKLVVADIAPVTYAPHHNEILQGLQSIDASSLTSRKEADEKLQAYITSLPVRQFILKNLTRSETGGFKWRINVAAITAQYDQLRLSVGDNQVYNGPALFLRGAQSDYITDEMFSEIHRKFSDAEIITVDNASHWLHAEQPSIVASAVIVFLQTTN
ncbi:alpha/beta fold hydrolase [Aurantivibrio plasticivorans]